MTELLKKFCELSCVESDARSLRSGANGRPALLFDLLAQPRQVEERTSRDYAVLQHLGEADAVRVTAQHRHGHGPRVAKTIDRLRRPFDELDDVDPPARFGDVSRGEVRYA